MARNIDDGISASGQAAQAMQDAAALATFYEDHPGVEIVTPGSANVPVPVTGDPVVTGVHHREGAQ